MKMALSEFALREKGIYGVLHIVILLLSLFLVVSISVDTFKGIPNSLERIFLTESGIHHHAIGVWKGSWEEYAVIGHI